MIRLIVFLFLGAVIADHFNLLPIDISRNLNLIINDLKNIFSMDLDAVWHQIKQFSWVVWGFFIACFLVIFN